MTHAFRDSILPSLAALSVLLLFAPTAGATRQAGDISGDICDATAALQLESAMAERKEELKVAFATCLNLTDPVLRAECEHEAKVQFEQACDLERQKFLARLRLCDLLGGGAYDPQIDQANYVSVIDNPYLPFPVGAEWTYETLTEEGELETIVVTVLPETREILGVTCVTVRDVVTIEGEPIEDTIDWYAQDVLGNVWYFGEISFNFEDGFVADIAGSWLSGVDGAKPGIVMLGDPSANVGRTYRQEWLLGEAEDAATVLDDDVSVTIGLGTFGHCVQTADFLPPEPDALEHKFYAPGIGFIFETKPGTPETLELVSYTGLPLPTPAPIARRRRR